MCASLVLLANGTASNKVIDEHRESQPTKITFNNGLGVKMSEVAREGGRVDGVK